MGYTWTTPPTWGPTDTPDDDDLNEISENLRFLHSKDRVHAYRTSDTTISDSTWELVHWDAEDYDTNSMHNNVSDNGRLTCQSDGLYFVTFKINFETDTTGNRKAMLRKNSGGSDSGGTGLGTWIEEGIPSDPTTVDGGRGVVLNTGGSNDYVELFVYQTTGGGLDVLSGVATSFLQMIQITG